MAQTNNTPVVEVKDLVVHYETQDGVVEAVNKVSFSIKKGEVLGLVGETGAGKTTIALSLLNLLPVPPSHIIQGQVTLNGEEIIHVEPTVLNENGRIVKKENAKVYTNRQMQRLRGKTVSMIFQDPMTALNPTKYVGDQIAEVIYLHDKCSRKDAMLKACEMMKTVGITPERYNEYPHQFSGGMKQRIVIAIALACQPELLIADEPTTALDVTIQAQVLAMMKELQQKHDTAMLMITHDLGIVAEMCDNCAVIYAGEIVEYGNLEQIFDHPMHPYTLGLMASIPSLDKDVERLSPIPGLVADPTRLPSYCSFCDRCSQQCDRCKQDDPALVEVEPGHFVKCFRAQQEV